MVQSECSHFLILLYQSCRKQKCFSLLEGQYSFCFTWLWVFLFSLKNIVLMPLSSIGHWKGTVFGHSDSVILTTLLCWISIPVNVVWLFVTAAISLQVTADRRYQVIGFLCLWFYVGQPVSPAAALENAALPPSAPEPQQTLFICSHHSIRMQREGETNQAVVLEMPLSLVSFLLLLHNSPAQP